MMSKDERNITVIKSIIDYCDKIEEIKNRFGASYDIFKRDFVYQSSTEMCLFQIGELTNRLTDDFKAKCKHIEWRNIKDLRNIFAHTYEKVDITEVWKTLINDVPVLFVDCMKIIHEYEPEYELEDELEEDEYE